MTRDEAIRTVRDLMIRFSIKEGDIIESMATELKERMESIRMAL